MALTPVTFDRRRVYGRRMVFPSDRLDVWFVAQKLLRLDRTRVSQIAQLADCFLLEDAQTTLAPDAETTAAETEAWPESQPSLGQAHRR